MPYSKGRNQTIAIKQEGTRGVAETTGFTRGLPWEDFSVVQSIGSTFKDESADGSVSALQAQEITSWIADGTIKGKFDADNVLWALAGAFGTATPTTADGATTWALSVINSNLIPTHTINYSRGDDGWRTVRGASIDKISISITQDDSTYSVEMKGVAEETGVSMTPTYTKQSRYLLGFNTTLGYATTKAGLTSATTLAKVKTLDFELMNDVKGESQFLGSLYRDDTPANGRTAMLKCTVELDASNSLQSQFEAGTKLAFRVNSVATNLPVIGTSALKPTFILDLPPSLIKKSHKIERDSYLAYDLEIEIEQAALITGTLINSLSTLQ